MTNLPRLPVSPTRIARRLLLPATLALATLSCTVHAAKPATSPITETAEKALWWGDFSALEKQNAEYRQPGRIDPDGASQLDLFRKGLDKVYDYDIKDPEPYMKEFDAMTLQWARANPRSALAHILHARTLLDHGYSYRGGTFANEVPPEAWEFFHRYLEQGAAYLKDHAEVALTDSYAHYILISIGRGLGWDREQMAAIVEDGLKRNPEDMDLYFNMVNSLLPKWGGNAKVLDGYIRHATDQTRARYGWGMYARLYAQASQDQYGNALFEDSHADWDKMKQGYEDLLARFPDSPRYRNRYAFMACLAKDKPTLLRLFGEIGTNVRTDAWGRNPERAIETCRRMATQL